MNKFIMEFPTSKKLSGRLFVENFLKSWFALDPRLKPDRFDLGEPIRRDFEKEGLDAAIEAWVTKMPLLLKRVAQPKFSVDISWREDKGKDWREFPFEVTVWQALKAGDDLAQRLFRFLVDQLEPAFAFLATTDDHKKKHFLTFNDKWGQVEMYIGRDLGNDPRGCWPGILPGVYWLTYFGKWAIGQIGAEKFHHLDPCKIKGTGNYLIVKS